MCEDFKNELHRLVEQKMHAFQVNFGGFIRHIRKYNELTLMELANLIDMSGSYLGLIERGERMPSQKIIFTILAYFNLDYSSFMSFISGEADELKLPDTKILDIHFTLKNNGNTDYQVDNLKVLETVDSNNIIKQKETMQE